MYSFFDVCWSWHFLATDSDGWNRSKIKWTWNWKRQKLMAAARTNLWHLEVTMSSLLRSCKHCMPTLSPCCVWLICASLGAALTCNSSSLHLNVDYNYYGKNYGQIETQNLSTCVSPACWTPSRKLAWIAWWKNVRSWRLGVLWSLEKPI